MSGLAVAALARLETLTDRLADGDLVGLDHIAAGVGLILTAINVLVYIFSLGGAVLITIGGRRPEIELLTLGASNMVDSKGTESIKIKVDRHVSETMVNELGAVIMNINDGAFEAAPAHEEAAPAYEAPAEEAAEAVEA